MKKPFPFALFEKNIEFIAARKDEAGFTRIWGYFVDSGDRIVAFWRHTPGRFTFKVSDTYAGNLTISDKVREKGLKGYVELPARSLTDRLLRGIHHDFLDAKERGQFHSA